MKRVLIIDDEEDIRLLGKLLLRNLYDVAEAASATEGLELVASLLPDVVLLDIRLPDKDGWTILKLIRADERFAGVRVVMVSAHVMAEAAEQARALGADGYIIKPFTADQLSQTIEDVLSSNAR